MPRPKSLPDPPSGTILRPSEVRRVLESGKVNVSEIWIPNKQQFKVPQRTEFEILYAGGRYGGKAQPLDAKVLTPYGWHSMSDMKVGKVVCNPKGGVARVIGVFPQGRQPIWGFKFRDGAVTRATPDHLWLARRAGHGIGNGPWKLYTSRMMKEILETQDDYGIQIPLAEPVQFSMSPNKNGPDILIMPPYLLGVLLGDGYLAGDTVKLTCSEGELVEMVRRELRRPYYLVQQGKSIEWSIVDGTDTRRSLFRLGCWGHKAETKFVPKCYLEASEDVRRSVLQGLMDTDGYIDSRGHVYFTSVSPRLAEDVQYLSRGLGFKASVSRGEAGYRDRDGIYIQCQNAYDVTISGRNPSDLFRLSRKKIRCQDFSRTSRGLVSVKEIGEAEAQCIVVDDPSGLYITDDFVVTHNSALGIRWLTIGNPDRPNFDSGGTHIQVDSSYLYHPKYLAAVIRKNEKDLAEWVSDAKPVYRTFGGQYTKYPAEFNFPSGARIFLGHMEDKDAWEKYQGLNITRYLIEEAGQIPDKRTYELLKSSCRCPYPGMRAQLLLNANPIGAFLSYLFDRFIEPKHPTTGELLINPHTDRPYQPEETIEDEVTHPFTGKKMILTRCWIPSLLTDNPYAVADPTYALSLASITDEKTKRAFLYGDWRAFRGSWFSEWNKDRHTLPAAHLPISSWMTAYASCDIGYEHDAACHWARQNPETQQICVYKEFGGSHIEAFELGAEIARHSLEELKTQPRLVVFVSHDAYHERTGDITYVDLLRQGASKILGKNAVFVPDRVLDQMKERTKQDGRVWNEEVEARLLEVRDRGLIFRRAPRSRVVGFTYMRGLMRLIPLVDKTARPDWEVARRICFEDGPEAYYKYLRLFANPEEILPKLLIAKECVRVISGIPKLVHDEDKVEEPSVRHFEDMDFLESLRYLLLGMRDSPLTPEPADFHRDRVIAAARLRNPNLTTSDLIWINRFLEDEAEEKKRDSGGFSLPRSSRALARSGRMLLR